MDATVAHNMLLAVHVKGENWYYFNRKGEMLNVWEEILSFPLEINPMNFRCQNPSLFNNFKNVLEGSDIKVCMYVNLSTVLVKL